jgi:LPXTG-motif cell wall-anchored protein
MRIFLNIVAVLLTLVGVGWFLQGINVLPGSVMSGQVQWAIYGGIAAVLGIGLLVFANKRKNSSTKK